MSVAEVKQTKLNLKAWIDQLSDVNMLSMLDGLRTVKTEKGAWDALPGYHKQQINEGWDDIENGRVLSSQEFWHELKNGR